MITIVLVLQVVTLVLVALVLRRHVARSPLAEIGARVVSAAATRTPPTLPVRPRLACVLEGTGERFTVGARSDGSPPAIARPPGGRGAFRYAGHTDAEGRHVYARV